MTILRDATSYDSETLGNVAWVAEESKRKNFDVRETYARQPAPSGWVARLRLSSPSRDLASLGITFLDSDTIDHDLVGLVL